MMSRTSRPSPPPTQPTLSAWPVADRSKFTPWLAAVVDTPSPFRSSTIGDKACSAAYWLVLMAAVSSAVNAVACDIDMLAMSATSSATTCAVLSATIWAVVRLAACSPVKARMSPVSSQPICWVVSAATCTALIASTSSVVSA